eukprot:4593601-Pleurochrysis_carterae.AAC.2
MAPSSSSIFQLKHVYGHFYQVEPFALRNIYFAVTLAAGTHRGVSFACVRVRPGEFERAPPHGSDQFDFHRNERASLSFCLPAIS